MKRKLLSIMAFLMAVMGASDLMAQETDVTTKIKNPSFELGGIEAPGDGQGRIVIPEEWNLDYQVSGWKDGFVGSSAAEGSITPNEGAFLYNFWAGTITSFDLNQELVDMPKGKYTLTAVMASDAVNNQHIYAIVDGITSKSSVLTMTNKSWETLSVVFNVANENSTIKIGAAGNAWCCLDNFTLSYVEVNLDDFITSYNTEKQNLENMKTGATQGIQAFIDEVIASVANPEETESWYNQAIVKLQDAQKTVTELKAAYADFELKCVPFETFLNASVQHTDASAKDTYSQCITTAKADANAAKDVNTFSTIMTALENGRLEYSKVAIANDGETLDYTFYIVNPNAAQKGEGWTITTEGNGNVEFNSNEHWSEGGTYFNPAAKSWGQGDWAVKIEQTITIPNGIYMLKAAGRLETETTLTMSANGKSHAFISNRGEGGTIATDGTEWESVADGIANGKTFANGNKGRGWNYGVIEDINVTNGSLTITVDASAVAQWQWSSISDFQLFKVGNEPVSVNLTMTEAGWATLMLPFDADIQDGMEVYSCSDVKDNVLALAPVTDKLAANTPYIIKADADKTFAFSGNSQAVEDSYTSGLLTGVYKDTDAPVGSYVLQNQKDGDGVAFYRVEDGADAQPKVKANRAYLQLSASEANVRVITLPGDTDGVESVDAADVLVDVYTMSGIRVRSNVKKSEALNGLKGVYILKAVK